jgi:F0F1-type ATP synthase assembly protein I
MLEHRSPDEQESAKSSSAAKTSAPNSSSSKLPMLRRTQAMGTRGLHAASIGWVLVGCIGFGFAVGAALDKYFGTTFCMPAGVLIGIAAGFAEMFRTLSQLQKSQDALKKTFTVPEKSTDQSTLIAENRPRPNIFNVPEPPVPSYMKKPGEVEAKQPEIEDMPEDAEVEALIEKLLSKDKDGDKELKS